tara:strand:- start:746 stop:886 length:141 start_codon:yes stop_codon:yes gene_type:complete
VLLALSASLAGAMKISRLCELALVGSRIEQIGKVTKKKRKEKERER